ncbi:DNA topoisomerase IV subunit A [compost metagenome]
MPSEGSRVVWLDVVKSEKELPEKVRIILSGRCKARVKEFEFDLAPLSISSRAAKGLTVTKWPVRAVEKG